MSKTKQQIRFLMNTLAKAEGELFIALENARSQRDQELAERLRRSIHSISEARHQVYMGYSSGFAVFGTEDRHLANQVRDERVRFDTTLKHIVRTGRWAQGSAELSQLASRYGQATNLLMTGGSRRFP